MVAFGYDEQCISRKNSIPDFLLKEKKKKEKIKKSSSIH